MGSLGWGYRPTLYNLWPPLVVGIQAQTHFSESEFAACVLRTKMIGWLVADCIIKTYQCKPHMKMYTFTGLYSTQKWPNLQMGTLRLRGMK